MCSLSLRSLSRITFLLALASPLAFPQAQEPKMRSVSFYKVKPGEVGNFVAATKEYAQLMKKAGSDRFFTLWVSQTGPREYALVRNMMKWSELDEGSDPKLKEHAQQLMSITTRINDTIESSHRTISLLDAERSLPMANIPPPPMVRVIRNWVRPDQVEAFRNVVKTDLLPAAKKSGVKLWGLARASYGDSNFLFEIVTGVQNWAELDEMPPVIKAMGGEPAMQKLTAKLSTIVQRTEFHMYRFIPENSHLSSTN